MVGKRLIFGVGTGRCGTVSLYRLLNAQPDSFFTHESKPLLPWKFDSVALEGKVKKWLGKKKSFVGEVNLSLLPYVEYLCKKYPSVRIVVLKRKKELVVKSFLRRTKVNNWNHWVDHDGKKWNKSKLWDVMFPKYKLRSKRKVVEYYWDEYYAKVRKLKRKYPKNIRVFQTEELNTERGVRSILDFCGFSRSRQKVKVGIWQNRSFDPLFFLRYLVFWRADKL